MTSDLVNSYSSALYEMAKEGQNQETFESELTSIQGAFNEAEIAGFFASPVQSLEDKYSVLEATFRDKISNELLDFLKVLVKNSRTHLMTEIITEFVDSKNDSSEKVLKGMVYSAETLSDSRKSELKEAIEQKLNCKVSLNYDLKPTLGAGIEAHVGSYLIEDNLLSGIQKMKETIKRSTL